MVTVAQAAISPNERGAARAAPPAPRNDAVLPAAQGFHEFAVVGQAQAALFGPDLLFLSETELPSALRAWLSAAWPAPAPQPAGAEPYALELAPRILEALRAFAEALPPSLLPAERGLIARAFVTAHIHHEGVCRKSGEPYILHPLAVATILLDLGMDAEALCAALLHDVVEDSDCSLQLLETYMGPAVARLVDGVTKLQRIDHLSQIQGASTSNRKAETLRKMFVAMVDDMRVVIVKLADRVHNMRTLDGLPPLKRKTIAHETLQIFAPLANRLGMGQFKWELEDLSLRHLDREVYDEISRSMAQKRQVREAWAQRTRDLIQRQLEAVRIDAEVTGRPKHIYSVFKKMERKGIPFSEVYDIQGFRIVTDTVSDCYAALGVIHGLWRPIPGEFDDYIASPKENMYQSLHTAVIGPDGTSMEVQIRTREMHEVAELGVAAHWHYKERGPGDEGVPQRSLNDKIALMRSLMDWRQDDLDAEEFVQRIQSDVFQDRVYVFTPQGDVIDLPRGATPIDFAYQIHSELGERCRGAKVNGVIVPLNKQLQNGDQVNIIAAKRGGPSRDWLNQDAGYIRTQRARSKLVSYFRRQARSASVADGRLVVDRELKRYSVKYGFEELSQMFGYKSVDDFLAAVGYSDISVHSLAQKILDRERQEKREQALLAPPSRTQGHAAPQAISGTEILGQSGLFAQPAGCCKPLPGERVLGYITRGKGVTVHKEACPNLKARRRDPEEASRIVPMQWEQDAEDMDCYDVSIEVQAYDRAGLLRDITAVVADEKLNMRRADAHVNARDNVAIVHVDLDIRDVRQLSRVMSRLDRLPNVRNVRRKVS